MRANLYRLAVALLALAVAPPGAAQGPAMPRSELPGLGPADPRRPADVRAAPFASLVRVQTELGGRCTGTLIAPDEVLTAAHCLMAPRSRQMVQPGSVHVLLAYDRGQHRGHARVASYRAGAAWQGDGSPASADWAVLRLATPLRGPVLPLAEAAPAPRTALALAGYQQDRPESLLADTGCRVLGIGGGMLVHDCAGTRGASGAPLLMRGEDGRWLVVGVASRVSRQVALGEAVPAWALR